MLTFQILVVAGCEELEGLGGPLRCLDEALAANVLAGGLQQVSVGCLEVVQSRQIDNTDLAGASRHGSGQVHLSIQFDNLSMNR